MGHVVVTNPQMVSVLQQAILNADATARTFRPGWGWVGPRTAKALFPYRWGPDFDRMLAETVGVCSTCWTVFCRQYDMGCRLARLFGYNARTRALRTAHVEPGVYRPYRPGRSDLTPPEPGTEPAGSEPGCDRCGALEHLGWCIDVEGRTSRLCPTHLLAEKERAYARRMAELGVRTDIRRFISTLPPHAYWHLPDIC
ncbi:hypothetical protein [Nocardiopsis sp. FR26]|uniref:hypothetical protein n=1 Tax=Nocardiopsis sp. FR26 TaxID=2605987 RepID=UPI001358C29F|nr:hypothetical protein [Nocardiopsis sp. FR26]